MLIHPDRLFPVEPAARDVARRLYAEFRICPSSRRMAIRIRGGLPRTSPFRIRRRCSSFPTTTFSACSTARASLWRISAFATKDGGTVETRSARDLAALRCALSSFPRHADADAWLDHTFATLFGFDRAAFGGQCGRLLRQNRCRACARRNSGPRALFERFRIEAIATTESPLDPLKHHETIRQSGWKGRVITAYRPDPVVDPEFEGFRQNLDPLRRDHGMRYLHLGRLSGSAS